jgi:IclR family transcriptional regulator, KDG regulon repressor
MPASSGLDSWHRASGLLDTLGASREALGVSALSEQLHLPKSTVARYLSVLNELGFVRQSLEGQRYRLGPKLYILGRAVPLDALVRDAARPHLVALAEAMGETTILTVVDGPEALCIEKIESVHPMRLTARIGERVPLHCGSSPRCLLAYLPQCERDAYLARPLTTYSPRTITDPAALRRAIAETRVSGYVVSRSEIDEGMVSVAAPIGDGCDSVVAAISMAGPAIRLTEERLPAAIAAVRATAAAISAAWQAIAPHDEQGHMANGRE